ncbi:MAG: hypothetical protein MJE77_39360 [Proteobacteria bacterium]|nr:hypothetical protein [Pseudomonadota bacterium]
MNWLLENKEWILSGVGVAIVSAVLRLLWVRKGAQSQHAGDNAVQIQGGRDVTIGNDFQARTPSHSEGGKTTVDPFGRSDK